MRVLVQVPKRREKINKCSFELGLSYHNNTAFFIQPAMDLLSAHKLRQREHSTWTTIKCQRASADDDAESKPRCCEMVETALNTIDILRSKLVSATTTTTAARQSSSSSSIAALLLSTATAAAAVAVAAVAVRGCCCCHQFRRCSTIKLDTPACLCTAVLLCKYSVGIDSNNYLFAVNFRSFFYVLR